MEVATVILKLRILVSAMLGSLESTALVALLLGVSKSLFLCLSVLTIIALFLYQQLSWEIV